MDNSLKQPDAISPAPLKTHNPFYIVLLLTVLIILIGIFVFPVNHTTKMIESASSLTAFDKSFCNSKSYLMVWEDNMLPERKDNYDIQSDSCNGYRCAVGEKISPACYNENECESQCDGKCLHVAKIKNICQQTLPSPYPKMTDEWKVYTNSVHGYIIDYPSDWTITFEDATGVIFAGQGDGKKTPMITIISKNDGENASEVKKEYDAFEVKEIKNKNKTFWVIAHTYPIGGTTNIALKHLTINTFDHVVQAFKFTDLTVTPATILHQTPATKPYMKIYPTEYGFMFQYPDYFILNNTSTSNRISFLQQQNDIKAQRLLVEITDTNQSLQDFAKSQNYYRSEDFPIVEESQIIDGHQALALTKTFSMQDICHTGSYEKMKRTSMLLVKGADFIVSFIVNDSCYTLENDWFSQIPPTIKFAE